MTKLAREAGNCPAEKYPETQASQCCSRGFSPYIVLCCAPDAQEEDLILKELTLRKGGLAQTTATSNTQLLKDTSLV